MSTIKDMLRPELVWIEGRCYRVNDSTTEVAALQEHDLYENEIPLQDDDDNDEDFEVEMFDDNRYSTSFHVSKHYLGSIIGKKGAVKNRIEHDTKTTIKIPKPGQDGDIVIFGPSAANVKAARRRINIIIISSRMKQPSTHFVSIPITSPEILKNFEIFKESVIRECSGRGLDETLFIAGHKLHLTLGVMCLMDNEERLTASKLLTSAKESIILPLLRPYLPLRLRLKGLSYMNDDPKEIDVMYGCVKEETAPPGLLQNLVDALVESFRKTGLMEKEHGRDNVKLHVTLLNSKYRKQPNDTVEEASSKRKSRETFDGSQVLEKFGDFDFGVAEVNDIHLSQRHSTGHDGYYQPTCIISCCRFSSE